MGAQRSENSPCCLPEIIIANVFSKIFSCIRQNQRQSYVAKVLVLHFSHHSAHRLNNIYFRTLGLQETESVKAGNIHSFGEDFGVRQKPNFSVLAGTIQPVQSLCPLIGSHSAVNMSSSYWRFILISCYRIQIFRKEGKHSSEPFAVYYFCGVDDGFSQWLPTCNIVFVPPESVVETYHLRDCALSEHFCL